MSGIYFKRIQWPEAGEGVGWAGRWNKIHHVLIIKAGHGHMWVCFNVFFTFGIEIPIVKEVFLSKMVLLLNFLNNATEIQIYKSCIFDGVRTI